MSSWPAPLHPYQLARTPHRWSPAAGPTVRGTAPRYVEPGYLLYAVESGALMAVRFDAERLAIAGDPVGIVGGVALYRGMV